LYSNIMEQGGSFVHWKLTPAPYFFPDMFLYFFSNLVTGNYYTAIILSSTLQFLLLFYFFKKIYQLLFGIKQGFVQAAILMVIIYTFDSYAKFGLVVNAHHFGALFMGIIALYYILALLITVEEDNLYYYFLLLIVNILIVMSDKLYIVQFLIPFSLVLFFVFILNKRLRKKVIIILFALVLSVILGYLFNYWLVSNPTGFSPHFSFSYIQDNIPKFRHYLKYIVNYNLYSVLALVTLYILIFILYFFKKSQFTNKDSVIVHFLILVCLLSPMVNIVVLLLSNLAVNVRYMFPVFFMPLLIIPLILNYIQEKFFNKYPKHLQYGVLLFCIVWLAFLYSKKISFDGMKYDYYPKETQCLDNFIKNKSSKKGISEYWDAKKNTLLSKENILVTQFNYFVDPYLWICTSDWYNQKFNFALIRNSDAHVKQFEENLLKINGKPDEIHDCRVFKVYYYSNGLKVNHQL